jgi:hypothetical protein
MPARPSHIPHTVERTTATRGLPFEKLYPSGKQTVASMIAKGWIEGRSDDQGRAVYCITAAGQGALKAPIPGNR